LGGVDEISAYQYNIESLRGSYKKEPVLNADLYASETPGSIAGEGCVMFAVNNKKENAVANVKAICTLHSENKEEVINCLKDFLAEQNTEITLMLTGESGDSRYFSYYADCETLLPDASIARFKHMSGEYPTSVSFALWFACRILQTNSLPAHALKKKGKENFYKKILLYNNYQGKQHSFMLLEKAN
jgi:hypothetical protein